MPTVKDFKMLEKKIEQDKKKLEQMASELKHSYAPDCTLTPDEQRQLTQAELIVFDHFVDFDYSQ